MAEGVNWTNASNPPVDSVLVGINNLPTPIVNYMRRSMGHRPPLRKVYHVTEILYCLRKAYYKRVMAESGEGNSIDAMGLWNIFRGNTFDGLFSPLFEVNQLSLKSERDDLTLTGTLDFIWVDESTLEKVLYDLKMPRNVYYKKSDGAGKFYRSQVQTYLAMAHENGQLMDVHRARVMMLADNLVIDEVPQDDSILERIWDRTFLLHEALMSKNPANLLGPEDPSWECVEAYCPGNVEWRLACKNYGIVGAYPRI